MRAHGGRPQLGGHRVRPRWAAIAAALLAAAIVAAPAAARVVRLRDGTVVSLRRTRRPGATPPASNLLQAPFPNLQYNDGPVMTSNANYAFYWDPAGAPAYPPLYRWGVDRYFRDLQRDSGRDTNQDSVAAQYGDAEGAYATYSSSFAGEIVDRDPYPRSGCAEGPICLTDAQLRRELERYIAANGLPADLGHEYFFLPPPGVNGCFDQFAVECSPGTAHSEYCAYHSSIALPGGGVIVYAVDPYVTGNEECDEGIHPNGLPSDGVISGGLAHEHDESVTDPVPGTAWEETLNGEEIVDKCEYRFGAPLGTAPDGARYNELIGGHPYWYEEDWSNRGHECLQRLQTTGPGPVAAFTSSPGPGRTVALDASASSAPGGVAYYAWELNYGRYDPHTELSRERTVITTGPLLLHAFPRPGAYEVGLTVYARDGTGTAAAEQVLAP